MSGLNIVHVTPTPLVGAPGKLASAQRMRGHDAIAVGLAPYPQGGPLGKMFLDRTVLIDAFTQPHIEDRIKAADIVHLHNSLPAERLAWLSDLNQTADYVYQVHSPLREGPLYIDRSEACEGLDLIAKLVVGQYAGRMYPDFTPVPNLILTPPSIKKRGPDDKLRVMFSPSHSRTGRWNAKYSAALEETLKALKKINKIELISPDQPVAPEVLMEIRRGCHVSIDEIATGAFHQISLEAMCAGNIAINRADFFCKATFGGFCDGEMPPFLYADDGNIAELLLRLADDWEETARRQQESYDYFKRYCDPLRLVEVYDAAYQRVN
ncbi:hypothetical protein [Yoonia sp. BS5-3]|uniref:Glycosyltransferase family 1 protein n=1 Tax=Yoonia phaeophyticola TaxID=3137369 RepID=A0ABZ2UZJ7_9RHOB